MLREALEEAIGDQDDMSDNCSDDSIECSSDHDHDLPVPMYTAASGELSCDRVIHPWCYHFSIQGNPITFCCSKETAS